MKALKEVIDHIHTQPGRPLVLLDAKRGDIDKTATAYAYASFESFGADCVTVNPYMGFDTIEPYLKHEGKGVFALCKTSNPGSNQLQTIKIDSTGKQLYEQVAELCLGADEQYSDRIGLVVGATDAVAMRTIRSRFPNAWILAPGVGAQGGDLVTALSNGINKGTKLGILIAVSRQISKASDPRKEAETLVNQSREYLRTL
jgi:orotidine 5'-phosphate decarboxylase subfamily 2